MSAQNYLYRTDGILRKVHLENVVLLQADRNYVRFHGPEDAVLIRTTLDAAMAQLPPGMFIQVSRTYAVAIEAVVAIGKDYLNVFSIGDDIPISKKYYQALVDKFRIIEANGGDTDGDDIQPAE